MAFFSGKDGAASFASVVQTFDKWDLNIKAIDFVTRNFTDAGFTSRLAGFIDAKCSFQGPYDPTNAKMVVRTTGNLALTIGSTYVFTMPGVLLEATYTQDTGDGARVKGEIACTGTFDIDLSS